MTMIHLVIPPKIRDGDDLIVTNADGVLTVHEFEDNGYEAHTCVPRYFGNMDLWSNWSTNERAYVIGAED